MSQARELANLRSIPTNGNVLLDSTAGDGLQAGGTCNIAAGLNALGAATTGDDNIAIGKSYLFYFVSFSRRQLLCNCVFFESSLFLPMHRGFLSPCVGI